MYKITNFIQKLIIIICCSILLFFVGAKLKSVWAEDNVTKFSGDFPAKQIRELWQVCSFTFQTRHPQVPQPVRWETCDCYVDVIRETLTSESARNSTKEEAQELTIELIQQCNDKFNPKPRIEA